MFCGKCGKEIPDGATFCGGCGAQQYQASSPVLSAAAPVEAVPKSKNKSKIASAIFALLIVAGIILFLVFGFMDAGGCYEYNYEVSWSNYFNGDYRSGADYYSAGSLFDPHKYEPNTYSWYNYTNLTKIDETVDEINRFNKNRRNDNLPGVIAGAVLFAVGGVGLKISTSRKKYY